MEGEKANGWELLSRILTGRFYKDPILLFLFGTETRLLEGKYIKQMNEFHSLVEMCKLFYHLLPVFSPLYSPTYSPFQLQIL